MVSRAYSPLSVSDSVDGILEYIIILLYQVRADGDTEAQVIVYNRRESE